MLNNNKIKFVSIKSTIETRRMRDMSSNDHRER